MTDLFTITKSLHDDVNKTFSLRTFQYDQCIVTLHLTVLDSVEGRWLSISEAVLHAPSDECACTELISGRCSPMHDSFSEIRRYLSRYNYQPLLSEVKMTELVTVLIKALNDLKWYADEYDYAISEDYDNSKVNAELFKAIRWLLKD